VAGGGPQRVAAFAGRLPQLRVESGELAGGETDRPGRRVQVRALPHRQCAVGVDERVERRPGTRRGGPAGTGGPGLTPWWWRAPPAPADRPAPPGRSAGV